MKGAWILVLLGVVAGTFQFLEVLTSSSISAPQQAAGAGMAIAFAILPYCFVRAIQFMGESPSERELKRLNELMQTHTRLLAALANATAASPADEAPISGETQPSPGLLCGSRGSKTGRLIGEK